MEKVSKWALQFLDPSDVTDTMKVLRAMTQAFANSLPTLAGLKRRADSGKTLLTEQGAAGILQC